MRMLPSVGARREYFWNAVYVDISLARSEDGVERCNTISYEPASSVTLSGPIKKITEAEIASILALNAGGSSWQRTRRGRAWMRRDKRAYAVEHKFKIDGVACNMLAVANVTFMPEVAAQVEAGL